MKNFKNLEIGDKLEVFDYPINEPCNVPDGNGGFYTSHTKFINRIITIIDLPNWDMLNESTEENVKDSKRGIILRGVWDNFKDFTFNIRERDLFKNESRFRLYDYVDGPSNKIKIIEN